MPALIGTTRRGFLAAASCALLAPSALLAPLPLRAAGLPARIVSLDYGLAETLLAMGVTPVAIAEADEWTTWVVDPPLPAGVINLGAALEANIELLHALRPDLILTSPYLARIRPMLERIARTETFAINTPEAGTPYERSVAATRRLGGMLGRETEAEALIGASAALMTAMRERLAPQADAPLLVVNFMDTRHVRIYGAKSLFNDVIERCGLANGWRGETNYWGFATVGIEQLADVESGRLIYLEPIAPDVLAALARSPLWNSLSFVRAGRVHRMPPALMFGMLPSAMRFARLLNDTLSGADASHG